METAKRKNTLVVLPTALGKTVIALLLVVERVKHGRVFFLAPTRPLVQQHHQTFLDKTFFDEDELVLVTGRFPPEKRASLYTSGKIIFATPQCVRNDLKNRLLTLEDVSLIVFDEPHRARRKVTILIAENTLDEVFYWVSVKGAERMKRIVRRLNRKLPQMLREKRGKPRQLLKSLF